VDAGSYIPVDDNTCILISIYIWSQKFRNLKTCSAYVFAYLETYDTLEQV